MCDAPTKRPSSQNIPRHKTSLVTKRPSSHNVPFRKHPRLKTSRLQKWPTETQRSSTYPLREHFVQICFIVASRYVLQSLPIHNKCLYAHMDCLTLITTTVCSCLLWRLYKFLIIKLSVHCPTSPFAPPRPEMVKQFYRTDTFYS